MDITPLLSYLKSTSNLALSCKGFAWRVRSNGFPIKTSFSSLTLENWSFYKSLDCPEIDIWINREVFRAIKEKNATLLRSILDTGADVDAKAKDGYTAIHWTVIHDRPSCLKILLERGANIEAANDGGYTALHCAGVYGRLECIKILLERGVNIEAETSSGYTVLTEAAVYGSVDCLKILLQSGARVHPHLRENYPDYDELWAEFCR